VIFILFLKKQADRISKVSNYRNWILVVLKDSFTLLKVRTGGDGYEEGVMCISGSCRVGSGSPPLQGSHASYTMFITQLTTAAYCIDTTERRICDRGDFSFRSRYFRFQPRRTLGTFCIVSPRRLSLWNGFPGTVTGGPSWSVWEG